MSEDDKIGYANPPRSTRWQKGQSGNPKGRPRSQSEIVRDAAKILIQPVEARGPDGRTIRLEAIEAAYLALCRKGLKGHKPSLLEAIRIMMDVGPAVAAIEDEQKNKRREIVERLERMGVPISKDPELRK
ncbi:DUF5681 domain-containing protein [Roseovarius sp. CAU 1744]|uniref:DUF5681 domain-containing protein n=1 Tax=Roseovarius sp. CAU 1744 TaxID=3140368 RepID=UPI00325ABE32